MAEPADPVENDAPAALREFVQWVATQRAYNGSDHRHAQSLYNECINAALPRWAEEFIAVRVFPPKGCYCLFEDGVIVRTDDGCPHHSKRPGVQHVIPPGKDSRNL